MTEHDKMLVNRIQLSQLASGDPYADDFYYQVYSSLRQRAGLPLQSSIPHSGGGNATESGRSGNNRGRREENMMQRMHQQLQRIVNDAKRRPKQTQVSLEGALGKITSLTVRNPRQVLQVPSNNSSESTAAATANTTGPPETGSDKPVFVKQSATVDKRHVLKITEDMYTIVLELEQMRRQGPPQARHEDEQNEKDRVEAFNEKYATKVEKLWKTLRLTETSETPFLVSLLSIAKGKKLIPRIVRQLNHDQNLTLLTVFIGNFSRLQVCRHVIYPGTVVANVDEAKKQQFVNFDDVELFMNATAPPLLAFIAEAPLRIVDGLLHLLLDKNDILAVAQTKPGLAFLTMLLSRAEILKQGGGSLQGLAPPTPEEIGRWQELYSNLFNTLQGRYLTIFPSLYYLVPLNPNTPMMQLSLAVDDMYVWQFLAAMAVGASMDQQHILVTEVRYIFY
jgi:DNA topoisomerase 2-associated protein PAT1